jgi:uncharacterized membrane protein (DUF2068 family)
VTVPPGAQHPRRRRQLDWELITCGVRGHALVGRDDDSGAGDPLLVRDRGDTRWHRCLRCDCWIALPLPTPSPAGAPTLDRSLIEIPLRGRALRDRIILRLIAIERLIHFVVLGLLGFAVLAFASHRSSLRGEFYRVLTAIQGGVGGGPVQSNGHVGIVHDLDKLFTLSRGTLSAVGIALLTYAALEGVEAVGLWWGRRWAEYLTFLATAVLLPLEVYEIIHGGTVLKVIGFLINLAVVVYLLFKKRLFGLRGGAGAEAEEHAREMSWERLAQTTPSVEAGAPHPAAAQSQA